MRKYFIIAAFFAACSIEDPSVAEFDLQKIRLNGAYPFESYFREPESYTHSNSQADLFYAMTNGDTMKVSVCEFENTTLSKAFFYNSDSIIEKAEFLIGDNRTRFFTWGRRVFIFSYRFSISQNSSVLDSLLSFTKRFPAADTSADVKFHNFSLKNSRADKDISVQSGYFLGIEAPFYMLVRRYKDETFTWACARSSNAVTEKDWNIYRTKWQANFYGTDSTALISRLSNGIVVAVYGDLDKESMSRVFREFSALVK